MIGLASHPKGLDNRLLSSGWDLSPPVPFSSCLCRFTPKCVCVPVLEKAQLEKAAQTMNQLVDKTVADEAGTSRKCHLCTMVTGVGSASLHQ